MPRRAKIILIKKKKVRGLTFSDFNTMWYWHKNRHIDQWNRNESSKTNPHIYSQLICNKGTKTIQWGNISLVNK